MAKQKKKTGCLGNLSTILIAVLLIVYIAGNAGKEADKKQLQSSTVAPTTIEAKTVTQEPTTAPTAPPTSAPTNTPEPATPAQPSIAGSQVYDIVLGLEEKGIPKAKTQTSEDAAGNTIYQHASSGWDDSSMISYNITSDHNHVVSYAVFNVSNGEAPWYLPFCATMPYESADPEKAAKFVQDNMKKEETMQIGDAIFAIYPNDNGGAMLTITAVGYEEWCLNQLAE